MAKQSKAPTITTSPLNPFTVTIQGMTLLFSKAQSIAMFFVALVVAGFVFGLINPSPSFTKDPTGRATEEFVRSALSAPTSVQLTWLLMAVVVALFILVVTTMLHGMAAYTALQLSKDRTATLSEAFNAVLNNFGRYFILVFLVNIKIALWTLLFIVPGIIAYYRYSFAGLLFFDEDKKLRGNEALSESSKLAKKGLLTIFASQFLFNLITFFYADRLITLSSQAILYREYSALAKSKAKKPKAHALSWIALAMPFVLLVALIVLSAVFAVFVGVVSAPHGR